MQEKGFWKILIKHGTQFQMNLVELIKVLLSNPLK